MKYKNCFSLLNKNTLFSCFILLTQFVVAQNFPAQNNPPKIINDFAGVLNITASLEADLVDYNNTTSNQITIVTINTTDGYDMSDYAIGLFNNWHIGQAKKDNGVLILVAVNDRKTFIVTGQGVEEYLPDLVCKKIIDNDMIPEFKKGNYDQGISNAIYSIKGYLDGTFKVEDGDVTSEDLSRFSYKRFAIVLVIFILVILLFMYIGRNTTYTRGGYYNGRSYRGGGGWGGWGGGGSSGGGGFGGFGGGSSGGGGAGGSW